MYCSKCGTKNSGRGLFCKHCGASLVEEVLEEQDYINNNDSPKNLSNDKQNSKSRTSNRTVNKNKTVNKTTNKEKAKKDKQPKSRNNKNQEIRTEIIHKTSAFQKIMILILILIIVVLLGALIAAGLYIFQDKTVEVPNVVGINVEQATIMLENIDLKVRIKEEEVDNPNQNEIVLEQSKKTGEFVAKNSKIILTVGKYNSDVVENYVGMNIEEAQRKLKNSRIKYEIKEVLATDSEDIVISQTPTPGNVLSKNTTVVLTVSKKGDLENNEEEIIVDEEPQVENE